MANMFSGKSHKSIPQSLKECTQQDATATNLHVWAERLETWGNILFWVLVVIGIFSTIVDTVEMVDINEDMAFIACITSLFTWGLYAFIEYCAYHVLALLISALASITQHSIITANVALYEAAKNTPFAQEASKAPSAPKPIFSDKQTDSYSQAVNRTVAAAPEGMWACQNCGTHNKNAYGQCKKCGEYRS